MVEVPVTNKEPKTPVPAPAPMPDSFRTLRREMDRLFDRFSHGFHMPSWRGLLDVEPAWRNENSFTFAALAVDVTEDDNGYRVTAEMPGFDEKNILISVTGDMLTLKGEKRQEKEEKEKDRNRYLSERVYGSFERRFTLPDSVDRDKISAELKKGVLTISLLKKAEARQPENTIEVKAAA